MNAFFFLFSLTPSITSLFFFNDPATTEISPLSLHAALPISAVHGIPVRGDPPILPENGRGDAGHREAGLVPVPHGAAGRAQEVAVRVELLGRALRHHEIGRAHV